MQQTTDKPARAQMVRNASGELMVARSLADPESAQLMSDLRQRLTSSPAESVKFLKHVGVLNRSGKLAKKFGG